MSSHHRRISSRPVNCAAAVIGVASIAGVLYQRAAERRDARRYQPPGRVFDVGGHRLHAQVAGNGLPVVIFESGLGMDSTAWCLVQPEVAKFTRTVSYDRAGLGWSDSGPRRRTSMRIARELLAMLAAAKIEGPYILVGHSFGGMHVRAFASLYPDQVAGVVLVDASPEGQAVLARDQPRRVRLAEEVRWRLYRTNPLLARLGVLRLLRRPADDASWMPEELRTGARALGLRSRAFDWTFTEAAACGASEKEVGAARTLGDIPLIVLTALWTAPERGLMPDAFNEKWMGLQSRLAALSSRSVHIIANTSAHFIPYREPQLIVGTVRQLIDGWRDEHRKAGD